MITEDDHIIILDEDGEIVGNDSGFCSESEVKSYIADSFNGNSKQEYTYCTLNKEGSVVSLTETDRVKIYSEEKKRQFQNIEQRANKCSLVSSINPTNVEREYQGQIHKTNIRYSGDDIDFVLRFDVTELECSVQSMSTREIEEELDMESVFNDIASEYASYAGLRTGFASRGRQNPYVKVYGKLYGDETARELHTVTDAAVEIDGVVWTLKNITPLMMYSYQRTPSAPTTSSQLQVNAAGSAYGDALVLTNLTVDDPSEKFSTENQVKSMEIAEEITDNYDSLTVEWVGTCFHKGSHAVCLGITQQ